MFTYFFLSIYLLKSNSTTQTTTPSTDIKNDIFANGLFEKDIVLTKAQAFGIFSKYLNESIRNKRQILNYNPGEYNLPLVSNSTLWSQEPNIPYIFNGSHRKIFHI